MTTKATTTVAPVAPEKSIFASAKSTFNATTSSIEETAHILRVGAKGLRKQLAFTCASNDAQNLATIRQMEDQFQTDFLAAMADYE